MKVSIREYHNKSRQGMYLVSRWKDEESGKWRTSTRKYESMSEDEFVDYVSGLKDLKIGSKQARVYYKKHTVEKKTTPKKVVKSKADYERLKEESWNALFVDRETRGLSDDYVSGETRIIARLKNQHNNLKNLSEEEFRNKLNSYMNYNNDGGNKNLFLDDIVNKWGVEVKHGLE